MTSNFQPLATYSEKSEKNSIFLNFEALFDLKVGRGWFDVVSKVACLIKAFNFAVGRDVKFSTLSNLQRKVLKKSIFLNFEALSTLKVGREWFDVVIKAFNFAVGCDVKFRTLLEIL